MDPYGDYGYGDEYQQEQQFQPFPGGYSSIPHQPYPAMPTTMPTMPRPLNPAQCLSSMRQATAARQLLSACNRRTVPQFPQGPTQYVPLPPHPTTTYQQNPAAAMESDPVIIEARKALEYSGRQLAYYQEAYARSQAEDDQPNMTQMAKRIKKHCDKIRANHAIIDEWQPPMTLPFMQGQPPLPYPIPGSHLPTGYPPIEYSGKSPLLNLPLSLSSRLSLSQTRPPSLPLSTLAPFATFQFLSADNSSLSFVSYLHASYHNSLSFLSPQGLP
jgi:hypothetical protein